MPDPGPGDAFDATGGASVAARPGDEAGTDGTHAGQRAEAATDAAQSHRVPLGRKIAYGIGELVIGIRGSSLSLVLFPFYTDVARLPPELVGGALAIGKLWDGINDPVIGYLSDHTRTRHGRRRPFLLWSAVPLALCYAALWRPPTGLPTGTLFAWLVGALFLLDVFFGFYSTPYLALGAEMSPSYDERTRIAAVRAAFHNLGLLLGGALLLALVEPMGGPGPGHARAGAIFAVVMAACALIAFLGTREPERAPRDVAPGLRRFLAELRDTLRLRSFRILLVAFGFLLVGSSLNQSFSVYVFRDALGAGARQPLYLLAYLAAATASFPFWAFLATRLGKNRAFEICLAWSIAALCASPVVSPDLPGWLVLLFVGLAGFGVGGYVLPVAIVADVFDEDELRSGRRREGAYFGVWTLVMKVASAAGLALAGLLLPRLGYVAGAPSQSPEVLQALKLAWGPAAALFFVATLLVFRRFPLTRERHLDVQRALAERHLAR